MNGTEKNGVGRREGESEAGGSSVAGVFMEDLRMGGRVVCCDPRDCARLVRRPGLITLQICLPHWSVSVNGQLIRSAGDDADSESVKW
jgi:hypothetical protein